MGTSRLTAGSASKRVGATYEVHCYYSPAGIFPTRVYPLLQPTGKGQDSPDLFVQVIDADDVIVDFQRIQGRPPLDQLAFSDQRTFTSICQPAIHAIALSSREVWSEIGVEAFKSLLVSKAAELGKSSPLLQIELAHFLKIESLEVSGAIAAVQFIAMKSGFVANCWVQTAALSKSAKAAASEALVEFLKVQRTEDDQPEAFATIEITKSYSIQGHIVCLLANGHVMIEVFGSFYIGKAQEKVRGSQHKVGSHVAPETDHPPPRVASSAS